MTPKVHRVIRGCRDLLYYPKDHSDLCCRFDLVYGPKSSDGQWRSPWPTLWPKGHGDVCDRFGLVYDPKRSQSHKRLPCPTLWPQKSRWPLWSVWPSLWPQKVTGSLEVALTFFMAPKVTVLSRTINMQNFIEIGWEIMEKSRGAVGGKKIRKKKKK